MKKTTVVMMFLFLLVLNTSAHPPKSLNVDYDGENRVAVKVQHPVSDTDIHHVETVVIEVNGEEVARSFFSTQGGKTGMIHMKGGVEATEGDVITVTANCNIYGSLTDEIEVGNDERRFDESEDLFSLDVSNYGGDSNPAEIPAFHWTEITWAFLVVLTAVAIAYFWDREEDEKVSEGSEDEYEDGGEGSGSRYGETILEEDGSDEEDADEDEDSSGRDYFDEEDGSSEEGSEEDVWHTREYLD